MIALVPVRDGVVPAGTHETISECGGRVMLVGSGTADVDTTGVAREVLLVELGAVDFGRWAAALAPLLPTVDGSDIVVLPHSPDGRDLAPRLAFALDRPLFAGAVSVVATDSERSATVARSGGKELHVFHPASRFVATLQPGIRGTDSVAGSPVVEALDALPASEVAVDASTVEVLPPDVRTMDLTEADRVVGGGAGLDAEQRFAQLADVAALIGASMGATRVVTDRNWVHHDKQIGTTGAVIDPSIYLAFGISGAVQHTAGLGAPDHIISVNTDPHCPMMAMSDLAIVADANETLDELLAQLAEQPRGHAGD